MILSGSIWVNITQENYPCNVGPWLTDNFYEGNNIYNVVPTSPLKNDNLQSWKYGQFMLSYLLQMIWTDFVK